MWPKNACMSRKWQYKVHKPFCLQRSLKTEKGNPGCVVWARMWPCCDCHPCLYKWWCMGYDVISLTSARPTPRLTLIMYKIKHNHGERHTSCFDFFFLLFFSSLFTVWCIDLLPQSSFITFSNFDPQKQACGDGGIQKKLTWLPDDIFPPSVRMLATDGR